MDYSKQNNEKKRKKTVPMLLNPRKRLLSIYSVSQCLLFCLLLLSVSLPPSVASRGSSTVHLTLPPANVMPSKLKSVMYYPDGQEAIELVGAQPIERSCRSMIFPSAFQTPL